MGEAPESTRGSAGDTPGKKRAKRDRLARREQSSDQPRKRKLRKRAVALTVVMIIGVAWVVLARSPLTTRLVRPQLAALTGARVELEKARVTLDGRLVLTGLKLGTPGIGKPGEPIPTEGAFIEVDRAVVDLDLSGIIRGRPAADRIDLESPVVRLSQNTETGQLNTAGLALFDSIDTPDGDQILVLPTVQTAGGVFELGDHDSTGYRMVQRFPVAGELVPARDAQAYAFSLRQLGAVAGSPIRLRGTVSGDGLDVVLDGVTLDDWPAELLPTRVRSFYTALALEGDIERTTLRLGADGDVSATIEVVGVGVTLPIDPDGPGGTPSGIRLERTTGRVMLGSFGVRTGSLTGEIASVRYEVELDYRGLDENSALEARVRGTVALEQLPDVVAILPGAVREEVEYQLEQFGHPTGVLEIDAVVSRDEPVVGESPDSDAASDSVAGMQASPIGARATFTVRDASATFRDFPYPFEDLEAVFKVDTFVDRVEMVSVSARHANGTELTGGGWFEPIGPTSEIELVLLATGLPVDDVLRRAMPDDRRALLDELFSEAQHDRLVEQGLVQSAEAWDALAAEKQRIEREIAGWSGQQGEVARAEIARLRERLVEVSSSMEVPVFPFGTRAQVEVALHRELGTENKWTLGISSRLPEAGLVPKNFPLPLVATNVALEIDTQRAMVSGGQYRGLTGGWASVEANLVFPREGADRPAADGASSVSIYGEQVPIDERLLNAVPGYSGAAVDQAGSIRRALTRLGLEGFLSCDAEVFLDERGELSYDVEIVLNEVRAEVTESGFVDGIGVGEGPLRLRETSGTVVARPDLVIVDLVGALEASGAYGPSVSGVELLMQIEPRGVLFGPLAGIPLMSARAEVEGLDLTLPLEDAAALVSDEAGARISSARARFRPEGRVSGLARVRGVLGAEPQAAVTVEHTRDLAFETGSGRVAFAGETRGEVHVANLPQGMVRFGRFEADVVTGGESAGRVMVEGVLPVHLSDSPFERAARTDVFATLDGAHFESAFVRTLLSGAFDGQTPEWFTEAAPSGEFDARLRALAPEGGGRTRVHGRIEPRSLGVTLSGGRAEFRHVSGAVVIDEDGARVEDVIAQADDWRVSLAGVVDRDRAGDGVGDITGELRGSLEARGMPETLLDAMPQAVSGALRGIDLAGESFSIEDARITLERAREGEPLGWRVRGRGTLTGGSGEVGVPLREVEGGFGFDAHGAGERGGFTIDLDASRLRAAGVRMTNAQAVLEAPVVPGPVRIDRLGASVHGGRIAGGGELLVDRSPVSYWLDVQAAGVRAAPVFDDLRSAAEADGSMLATRARRGEVEAALAAERAAWDRAGDESRGLLDGSLSITGVVGDGEATLGRGELRVAGGSVLALPGIINLIELSNLTLPVGATLDLARASFFVDGPVLTFEEISATSRQVELYGYGQITWPEGDVDLRFNSRAQRPIPVVGPIVQGLRDQFVSTKVTGTTSDPEITTASLAASRAALAEVSEEQRRRLRDAERRVRSGQARMREESRRAAERASTPARAPTIETAPEQSTGG